MLIVRNAVVGNEQMAAIRPEEADMGDKSPKAKDKHKKQGEAQKKQDKAKATAKQTSPSEAAKKK